LTDNFSDDFTEEEEEFKEQSKKFKFFSYKIFIIIIALAIIFQAYILSYEDTPSLDFPEYVFIIGSMTCGIISIIVGISLRSHHTFRTSYTALGLYFFLLAFGEIIYIIYTYELKIVAYPSMADVFYLAAAIFAFIHLFMNINYFKKKISTKLKIAFSLSVVSLVLVHSIFSLNQIGQINQYFLVGFLYASENSLLLPLAVIGIIAARKTVFGATWLLLVIGIFFLGIGQVWRIFLEFFGEFSHRHPVNTLWLFGFMVISFALVEHLRIALKKK